MNKQPIRVLCVTRAYGAGAGGMERLSFELLAALQQQPDIQIQIIARAGPRWLTPLFMLYKLPEMLWKARRSDVVHLGDPVLSGIGWLLNKMYRLPVAVTVHGLDILYPSALYQLYLHLFFQKFDLYLPISRHVATVLKSRQVRGSVVVITPGFVDRATQGTADRTHLGRLLGRDVTNSTVLFTVGRLIARKGQRWFTLHVLPALPARVVYVIAGEGPDKLAIEQAARDVNVSERVVLLGRVDDATLQMLYRTADSFVQPNIAVAGDVEGFGLVLLEAASAKQLVFAANIEGIPDAIVSGQNGVLLPSGDATTWIKTLTEFSEGKEFLNTAAAGEYTLAHYSWETTASRYASELVELVSNF